MLARACLKRLTRLRPTSQRYTSSLSTIPTSSIYISGSHNPYFNLTLEDWLFRHKTPSDPLLLIYRDESCVIIGRNQNPWKEVNFTALRARPGVPFIRRRSGGGTVYHDLGNTNFSIHLPRQAFDRHATAQVILRAVRSLDVDAHVNDRNDICVGRDKMSSAYKIVNKRAYHHGTMLISTQLDILGDLLRTNKPTMLTKGVASVRSPVCNLQQYNPQITHESFTQAVVNSFRKEYGIHDEVCIIKDDDPFKDLDYFQRGLEELLSWEWAYGQTPEFTYQVNTSFAWGDVSADIKSKHGSVLSLSLKVNSTQPSSLPTEELERAVEGAMQGKRYGFFVDEQGSGVGPQRDIEEWLRRVMRD